MRPLPEQLEHLALLVQQRLGLYLSPERWGELEALLRERAGGRVEEYLEHLASPAGQGEVPALAERLTVGETYLLRHPAQLQVLVERVLPERQREVTLVRVLCAGCSTGEEAWSVALLAHECPQVDSRRLQILGVDVNPRALALARRACYSPWSLRATPRELRERWFLEQPSGYFLLRPEARERVLFEERNLLDEAPAFWAPSSFDVILCRNVTLYFPPEVTRRLVERMEQALVPGGYLFLGPYESLRNLGSSLELRSAQEAFYYQRPAPAPSPRQAPVASPPQRRLLPASAAPHPAPAEAPHSEQPERLSQVLQFLAEERYPQARELLATLPVAEPLSPVARLVHALIHLQEGHLVEAERLGRQLAAEGLCLSAAHYLLGLCHEQAGDEAGARACYERAAQADPTSALAHLRLGMLARRAGAVASARVALRMALTLLPHEQPLSLALFGGGFGRYGLMQMGQQELRACTEAA